MKPKILKLSTIVLFMMLIMMGCKKDDDPEPEHFTITIYTDSLVFNDAISIAHSDSIVVLDHLHIEEFQLAPVNSTVVFKDKEQVTIKYLGGWRNPDPFEPDIAIDKWYPENAVFDTLYETRVIEASYAILEITQNGETRIDTSLLDRLKYMKGFQETSVIYNIDNNVIGIDTVRYLEEITEYFRSWEILSPGSFFRVDFYKTFYSIPMNGDRYYYAVPPVKDDKIIYLLDMFPYWQNPIISTELVFYINN